MPDMNSCDVAFEIQRLRPELAVILLSGSEVPKYALDLIDAFVPKLEASRALLPNNSGVSQRDSLPKAEARRVSAIAVPYKMTSPVTNLKTCTDEELENALARVLAHASGEVLNEAEVRTFYQLYAEIRRRSTAVTAA